jgi:hypothetical protein
MSGSNSTVSMQAVATAFWRTLSGLAAVQTPSPELLGEVLHDHLRNAGLRVVHDDSLFDADATVEMPTIQLPVLEVRQ